ncbi:hypothetical protein JW707_02960 [Candidatus Woesearchaeota archaeon]|nr:hypothetical protein [Candidatus Woesearchaeota archaeon]
MFTEFLKTEEAYDGLEERMQGVSRINFDDVRQVYPMLADTARALYAKGNPEADVRINAVYRHDRCSTNPYMVVAKVNGEHKVFYLKKPDVRRALGKAFYNLLVEDRFIVYRFNEEGFAVDAVQGREIEEEDRDGLMSNKRFVEELVRLNVFTNLVFLNDVLYDWTNSNCAYSEKHGIYLFDFDQCFQEGDYSVPLAPEFRKKVDVKAVETSEKMRIHRKMRHNRELIEALLSVVNAEITETELAWRMASNNIGDALRKRFTALGQW